MCVKTSHPRPMRLELKSVDRLKRYSLDSKMWFMAIMELWSAVSFDHDMRRFETNVAFRKILEIFLFHLNCSGKKQGPARVF